MEIPIDDCLALRIAPSVGGACFDSSSAQTDTLEGHDASDPVERSEANSGLTVATLVYLPSKSIFFTGAIGASILDLLGKLAPEHTSERLPVGIMH